MDGLFIGMMIMVMIEAIGSFWEAGSRKPVIRTTTHRIINGFLNLGLLGLFLLIFMRKWQFA